MTDTRSLSSTQIRPDERRPPGVAARASGDFGRGTAVGLAGLRRRRGSNRSEKDADCCPTDPFFFGCLGAELLGAFGEEFGLVVGVVGKVDLCRQGPKNRTVDLDVDGRGPILGSARGCYQVVDGAGGRPADR